MKFIVLLFPLAFIFHFVEIEENSILAFFVMIISIIASANIAKSMKKRYVIMIKIVSIALSVVLSKLFIKAPNESWFNPFSMETVIVLTDLFLLLLLLIVRSCLKKL